MRASLKMHQKFLIALAAVLTMLLLFAVAVWAYDNAQKDQIAPGVKIGGVDIGGRNVDAAREIVRNEVVDPLQKPVVVEYGGEDYTITARELRQTADVEGMLDEAVEESRNGDLFERISRYASGSAVNVNLEPRVGYSQEAVDEFVAELAGEINREAVNASIEPSGDTVTPEPGRKGFELQEDQTRDLITQQVEEPGRDVAVQAVVAKTEPEITQDELAGEYPRFITVDRTNYTLRFFRDLTLAKKYTIAVGAAGYDTPTGLYEIQTKEVNPTWHVPDSEWAGELAGQDIPPGPGNPLVARWMGIYDGAGIHGTHEISSLGTSASHGCIRMAVQDVVELFEKVEVGDPVYIQ